MSRLAGACVNAPHPGGSSIGAIHARLLALHPKRIDLSLGRIQRLLAALGHPERHLPPVIHVAGTNGKGSTVAFARAILEAAGKRAHVYTSPNLVRLNERFRIARTGGGKFVEDDELADVLSECEAKNGDAPITVFEIETAAAFLLFTRHPADFLLLEVGLGGRLDATNVMDKPLASVITRVSLDHRDFLGDTIESIAAEKAGILKPGVPAVIASQTRQALAVIEHVEALTPGGGGDRAGLADRLEAFTDRRVFRYWTLVGIINGWAQAPASETSAGAWEWYAKALRAHPIAARS